MRSISALSGGRRGAQTQYRSTDCCCRSGKGSRSMPTSRPHRLLPGVQDLRSEGFDILCIRENTEGEYSGAGGRVHSGTANEVAVETAIFTRAGCRTDHPFRSSNRRGRAGKKLASVTKSNAQKHSMVFWDEVTREVAKNYPDARSRTTTSTPLPPAWCMAPESLDVFVASNRLATSSRISERPSRRA